MNEVQVTVVGTVCSEVRYGTAGENGVPVARFQIRSMPRRYDRRSGAWTDGDPSYYSVTCWRRLAEHAASSLGVGDPVLATGRLKISRWKRSEESMVSAEIDAQSVGHDLRWGTSVYRKGVPLAGRVPGPRRRSAEELVRDASGVTVDGLEAVDVVVDVVEGESTADVNADTDALAETAMAA